MVSLRRLLLALLLLPASAAPAFAGCSYGDQSLPGHLAPGEQDTRSFTINGRAILTVSGATDSDGNPVELLVSFPGQCQERGAPTVSCTVDTYGVVRAHVYNPSYRRVIYDWVCSSIY